jgi:sugar phosphate isomerase/epimerase
MIKLSVAIADTNALSSAFVVFRGFEKYIPIAASMGYSGVELALKRASEINPGKLDLLLAETGMEVSCISTGQVFADTGYMFTDSVPSHRKALAGLFREMIDLASVYGKLVNIGRVRGNLAHGDGGDSQKRFIDMAHELCAYAQDKNVLMILEPVNRYEINFINSLQQGVELLKQINEPNFKLMPDIFHMNIEDKTIAGELIRHIDHVAYIHLADSNRLAPGQGHTDFESIFSGLRKANYAGWCSVEILPFPEPFIAAKQAAEFLMPIIENYNREN